MKKEYETKVIGIDKDEIEKKLISLGAKKTKDALMRRWVFDWVEKDPEHTNEWIRLRDEGDKVTLTYKKRTDKTVEIETTVEDFEKTAEILKQIPFKRKFYQENRRIVYELNEIEFMIDEWPGLEPYLEIESTSEEKVEEGLELLDLKGKERGDISSITIYKEKGIDLHDKKILRFEDFK